MFSFPRAVGQPLLPAACMLLAVLLGCRMPGIDSPASRSLVKCRQMSRQGLTALERDDVQSAERLLEEAVASCPVDCEARRSYAEALWRRGRQLDALAQLDAALRLAADEPAVLVRAGEMRLELGQADMAHSLAERAIDLEPKLSSAWALRARSLQALARPREALTAYHRALAYGPGDREVLLEVADLYLHLGEPHHALATLQGLVDTYPPGEEPSEIILRSGQALMAMGRSSEAADCLQAAAGRGQASPELLCNLAEALWASGRTSEARAATEQALALEPSHQGTRALVARMASDSANLPSRR